MSSLRHLRRGQQAASLKRPLNLVANGGRQTTSLSNSDGSTSGGSDWESQPATTVANTNSLNTSTTRSLLTSAFADNKGTSASTSPIPGADHSSTSSRAMSSTAMAQQHPAGGGGGVGGGSGSCPSLLYTTAGTNNIHDSNNIYGSIYYPTAAAVGGSHAAIMSHIQTTSASSAAAHFLPRRRSDTIGTNKNVHDHFFSNQNQRRQAFSSLAEEDSDGDMTDTEGSMTDESDDDTVGGGGGGGASSGRHGNRGRGSTRQAQGQHPQYQKLGEEDHEAVLQSLAAQQETPLSLLDIHAFGKSSSPAARIAQARFLHREVPIRFARRVLELRNLPYGLSDTAPVAEAAGWYALVVRQLLNCPVPEGLEGEEEFSSFLSSLLSDHTGVPQALSRGVLELRERKEVGVIHRHRIDRILDHFFISRISLRFLVETYISSKKNKPGFSGVIESECSPVLVAWRAAADVDRLCRVHMGTAPAIEVYGRERDTFTAVPSHLYYIIREVLKNSCRATVQHHSRTAKPGSRLPPVKVIVARGKEDMTIKIMDEGGGIRRSDLQHVWSYMYSTAPKPSPSQLGGVPLDHMSGMRLKEEASLLSAPSAANNTTFAFAGYGMGLPLSRLYARYFGGSLKLRPMEGYGTDAYIHLHRLKTNSEERLPTSLSETLRVMADDGRVHVVKTRSWKTPKDDSDARALIRSFDVQAK